MLETICDILVDAYKRNWIKSRDGNVSIRHHDRDHFYVTPSGVRKQTLQPETFDSNNLAHFFIGSTEVASGVKDALTKLFTKGHAHLVGI